MRRLDETDVLALLGLGLLALGIAAFDWRIACIVTGTLILAFSVTMVFRAPRA